MAILSWKEIWNGRRGELESLKATRRYERVFRAEVDSTLDGPATLLAYAGLLGLLTTYADANGTVDTGAILRRTSFENDDENPFIWLIRCEFSSEPYDIQQRNEEIEDPLQRPPIYTLDAQKFQRVVDKDCYGTPVANSAGAPFSPLPEVDDTRLILTVERNESSPDWPTILSYQDAVNSDQFMGYAPGSAKVSIKCQAQYENNLYYWKVTYTFELRNYVTINGTSYSGWDLHLLDRGFYALDSNKKPRQILDAQGNPPGEPVLLDGTGKQGTTYAVGSVDVTKNGSGYGPAVPTVSFSGGGGSGATAICVTANDAQHQGAFDPNHQQIVAVVVTAGGSGYTSAPTVTISAPGALGVQALASAVLTPAPAYLHYRPYTWLPFSVFNLPDAIN